jgi:hypothetical protein
MNGNKREVFGCFSIYIFPANLHFSFVYLYINHNRTCKTNFQGKPKIHVGVHDLSRSRDKSSYL